MTTRSFPTRIATEQLLQKQMRLWEASRAERLATPEPCRPEVEQCICISRQVGAGGFQVASNLSKRLGWAFFDRELLRKMAGDNDTRERVYKSMDERDLTWFEEALRAFTDPEFVRNDYFHQLTRAVLSIARQGHAVLLGRGSNLILPRESTVSARIVAPIEDRVTRLVAVSDMTRTQAAELIEKLEGERRGFVATHFHRDVDDPSNYDIALNSELLDAEAMTEAILGVQRARSVAPDPASSQ